MNARRGFLLLAGLAPLLLVTPADAGSYLNRAAMLVILASRESQFLRGRVNDKDLAELVHSQAVARLASAFLAATKSAAFPWYSSSMRDSTEAIRLLSRPLQPFQPSGPSNRPCRISGTRSAVSADSPFSPPSSCSR